MTGEPVIGSVAWVRERGTDRQRMDLEDRERAYEAGFRAGLEAAAKFMEGRKVSASEFYGREIRALSSK